LGFVSCVREQMTVFDATKATAPVLNSYDVTEDGVSASFTPGVFNQSFNQKMPVNHSLVIVSAGGNTVTKTVTASVKDGQASATVANLSKALMALGYNEGDTVDFDMVVRASMQEVSKDNGRNGYVDSEGRIQVRGFVVTIPVPQGNPWKEFTQPSTWGMIGSIASTGNNWNADGPMYMTEDGTKHVAMKVLLTPDDQFKVRKDGGWDTNFGAPGDTEPFVMEVGTAIEATPNGKNLGVPEEGYYDLLLDTEAGTLTLFTAFETYPGFDEVSTWSVIGNIPSVPMEWNKDIQMTTDGEWHVAEGVVLTTADQFKFRKDLGWDTNIGAAGDTEPFVAELDTEYDGVANGKNIAVPADGTYDLLVNPDAGLFKIVESLGGKSPLVGGDTPDPGKPAVWSLIGTIGGTGWDTDTDMVNTSGDIWVARLVTLTANDEFKIRADHKWDENYGGPEANDHSTIDPENPYDVYKPELGVAFAAGDKNIHVGVAGTYDVTFDYANKTIKIDSHVAAYSLIGEINGDSWSKDIVMNEKDGVWTSPVVEITGGFKIRFDFSWDDANTYGVAEGFTPTVGMPFTAVQPGGNITVPEAGQYKVQFTPATKEVVISSVAFPEHLYMIGDEFGGWDWNSDGVVEMTPVVHNPDWGANAEGQFWTVRYISAGKGFKFCAKRAWDGDFWGLTENDGFTEAGGNCTVAENGIYLVHVDLKNEKVHVEPARVYGIGSCFGGWDAAMEGALFVADGKVLKATTQEEGELRMYVESAIATSDWWTREFIFFDGKIDYRGDDEGQGDQARVNVLKGQVVTLDFNAGTATVTGEGEVSDDPKAWSLIGTLKGTSWDTDFDLKNTSGSTWVIENVAIGAAEEFKIRADHDWAKSVGGPEGNDHSTIDPSNPYDVYKPELGVAFAAGDKNIRIGVEGNYTITFDYKANTILIETYKAYPEHLYMIGEEFGGWDWNSDGVAEMIPVLNQPDWGANAPGQFWTVRYFHAGKGFKFCAKRAWDGDFWGLGSNDGFTEAGGNCTVAEDGFYLVHIDFANSKVHVEPARVFGIGDAFGGWNTGMESAQFSAADGKLSVTVPASGNLRMYVASTIATSDWWTREFNIIDGKITPRILEELAAPAVTAGQKVTLDFNTGTGVIE
jgi:hypothetical protein